MNVLLVNPYDGKALGAMQGVGGKQPPTGLLYLASVIERASHKVTLVDELVGEDASKLTSYFDVILLSVYPSCSNRAMSIIKYHRLLNPKIKVVIGGAVAKPGTIEKYLRELNADVAVMGEAEEVIADLVHLIVTHHENRTLDFDGTAYIDVDDRYIINGGLRQVKDLDHLPLPAIHLLNLDLYRGPTEQGFFESYGKRTLSIMTARGCQFSCHFCSSANDGKSPVRFRSPENIVKEVQHYVDNGVYHFQINDDTFTANIPRVIELCKLIVKEGLAMKIQWICQTRAELTTQEMFDWMKRAGCVMVAFGVESGSEKVLQLCNKRLDLDFVKRGFKMARLAGLRTKTYFQVGLPGEDADDFNMSVKLAIELNPDYLWLSRFTPLSGTKFYNDFIIQGMNPDDLKTNTFFSKNREPYIEERYSYFLRKFYIRPGYFIRFIKRFSIKEFLYLCRMSVVFLKIQFGGMKA